MSQNSRVSTYYIPDSVAGVVSGGTSAIPVSPTMRLSIVISLPFSNYAHLDAYLNEVQDPHSPIYHHYLTASEFDQNFSPSASEYNAYVNYFIKEGFNVKSYNDRVSMVLTGSAFLFETIFHTTISRMDTITGKQYYAPTTQLSLSTSYGNISSIVGLNTRVVPKISPLYEGGGSFQAFYGGDFQTLYQLNRLYEEYGYPTNVTIATILWSGTNSTGGAVAPFVPSNINYYFKNNLPPNEPLPKVYGYPVNGAPLPGPSAANDTTGVNVESTLDLEMAGSSAPGSNIVEVYGPNATLASLDQAFASILNPSYNTTVDNALSHIVAISNSWGTTDTNDSTWMQYEEEAAARGITVLASSGDNGNYNGAVAPNFPASMAYNNFGTLAVGGTTGVIDGTGSLNGIGTTNFSSQTVWNNTPSPGYGSQGGVSTIFNEPSWQNSSSDANSVIAGSSSITGVTSGRGTPDISADGSNMAIYVSSGTSTGYEKVWGTSIASPLLAGTIAVMDHSLGSDEGFINPLIYSYGQSEYSGTMSRAPPIFNVYNGSNAAFTAQKGYSLAVGWGTINAYNFVQAQKNSNVVTFEESGLPPGTLWYLNITGIGRSDPIQFGTYSIALANGTYYFTASTPYGSYHAKEGSSSFTLSGSATVMLNFTESKYPVTFSENGLPGGYQWYIDILNGPTSGPISGNSFTTDLANGTYQYTVTSLNGGYFSPGAKLSISGAATTTSIHFIQSAVTNSGYVKSTFYILNNTVAQGNNPNAESGFIPDCVLYDADNNYVYVGFSGSESISVLNGSTGQVIETIPMNMYPSSITYNKATNTLYTSNGELITTIDGYTNEISGTIVETGGVGTIMYLPQNGYLYVTNPTWDSVSIYSPSTGALVKRISVGEFPLPMVYDPMNGYIYVANEASANITVINPTSNSAVCNIPLGYYPSGGMTVNSNGTQLYLTADQAAGGYDGSYICTVNTSSNTLLYSNNIGANLFYPTEFGFSDSMVYSSSTGMVYATGGLTGKLYDLSPQSNCSIVNSASAGSYPDGIAIDPENGYIFVANTQGDSVVVINSKTMASSASVLLGTTPGGINYDQKNGEVYILGYKTATSTGIGVMNMATGTVEGTINSAGNSLIVDPANNLLYVGYGSSVSNFGGTWEGSKVYVINPSTYQVVASINIIGPNGFSAVSIGLAYDPHNGLVYATEGNEGAIDIINTTTNTVQSTMIVTPVSVGASLGGIIYDSANNYLYVENSNSLLGGALDPGIYIINATTEEVVGTIGITDPTGMTLNSAGNELFVATWTGTLEKINTTTNTVSDSLYFGEFSSAMGVTLDPVNDYLLVAIPFLNEIIVVNSTSDSVVQVINVGIYPLGGPFDPVNNIMYVLNQRSGTVSTIEFSNAYLATFNESSLPSGVKWYVNLSNGQSLSSTGSSISTHLPNGTYGYTISTSDKELKAEPATGSIVVNGGKVTQTVAFKETTYKLSFKESGLLTGTSWTVTLDGISESSTSRYVNFTEPNGTYSYGVQSITGYTCSGSSGSLEIAGANIGQTVTFTKINYTIKFVENGLPSGTYWFVNLSNGQRFSSNTEIIWLNETDGTYSYNVSSDNAAYYAASSSGTFNVNGADVNMPSITFGYGKFQATFIETGLPSGTPWYVNITGQASSGQITGSSYSITLTNGSYTYSIGTVNKSYTAPTGTFKVGGKALSQPVDFVLMNYTVTFTETGLSSGTSWSVTFNGVTNVSTTSTLTFSVQNGTYLYTVKNLTRFYTEQYSGSATLKGKAVSESVTFSQYSYIDVMMNPDNAALYINGVKETVPSNGSFSIKETAGSYDVAVKESGYQTFYDNFTIAAGHTQYVNATLNKISQSPAPITPSNNYAYYIAGGVAAAAAIGLVTFVIFRRRNK